MNSLQAAHQNREPHEDTALDASHQRACEVANDPIVQSAGPDVVIGAGRHKDAGGKPLDRLLGAPMEVGRLLRLVLN
jgi:hypothetical protein